MQAPLLILANRSAFGHTKRLRRSFSSLRFRLMLWYLLILALTLGFFSTAIYVLQQGALYNQADSNLQQVIRALPDLYDLQSGRLASVNIYTDIYADDSMSVLLDPQGHIVQTAGRMGAADFNRLPVSFLLSSHSTGIQMSDAGKQDLRFFSTRTPVIDQSAPPPWNRYVFEIVTIATPQGQILNVILVGLHTDIPDRIQQLLSVLVTITPLALLMASLGGYWLASRVTRPMQTITRTAQEISETDLHRRLNLRRHDELGELATTFDSMLDRLEWAFERQRQFTADASHELRTPLSIVNTEAERVLQRTHTCEEYIQTLAIIHQENQRMTRLVNDLLTLARADQGQTRLRHEHLDLSEIVLDAAERLAYLAEQNGIEVHLSHLNEIVVWGDRLYLMQLCTNLLENAIKYSADIGKCVEVRLDRKSDQARIQVRDEGPGIAAEHLPYLFERFFRVDQSRTQNQPTGSTSPIVGSGLGLSIARWIAQEHGGSIQVQSTLGRGTIFEVCLPLS
jgi:two-component system, OmpR family, sensor kinase